MDLPPSTEDMIFKMTWRTLSHAAVPAMLPATSLDANGLIPRTFCPDVYDGVKKTVLEMKQEAQFAVWSWFVPPGEADGMREEGRDGGMNGERGTVGWHPCFILPANRRVVMSVNQGSGCNTDPLTPNTSATPNPFTNTSPCTSPPPRKRTLSLSLTSSSILSTNPHHHLPNKLTLAIPTPNNTLSNSKNTHSRRSSSDNTRRMSSEREEENSVERSVETEAETARERIRRSSSLWVRPGMSGV